MPHGWGWLCYHTVKVLASFTKVLKSLGGVETRLLEADEFLGYYANQIGKSQSVFKYASWWRQLSLAQPGFRIPVHKPRAKYKWARSRTVNHDSPNLRQRAYHLNFEGLRRPHPFNWEDFLAWRSPRINRSLQGTSFNKVKQACVNYAWFHFSGSGLFYLSQWNERRQVLFGNRSSSRFVL